MAGVVKSLARLRSLTAARRQLPSAPLGVKVADMAGRAHFLRFTIEDEELLRAQIDRAREAMSSARASGDAARRLRAAIELGNLLTTGRCEAEACEVLAQALAPARAGPPEALGWLLLYLGTARQYLDQRLAAQRDFDEALTLARLHELEALESYVLHHLGRCLAEEGQIDMARSSFTKALALREALGDPRQTSSRRALDMLDEPPWNGA